MPRRPTRTSAPSTKKEQRTTADPSAGAAAPPPPPPHWESTMSVETRADSGASRADLGASRADLGAARADAGAPHTDRRGTRAARPKLPREEPSIPQRKGGTAGYWLYLLPGFVLLLVIVVIPLVFNVYLTFTKWRGVRAPEFIGLDNWMKIFTDEKFWTSFVNSVWMVLAMVVIPTLVGLI